MPDEIEPILSAAVTLAEVLPGVVGIALVGSWARGAAGPDSDVDLLVLTDRATEVLGRSDWYAVFDPDAVPVRSADFGAVQERRLRLPDTTVVEVGIAHPSWAAADPVDDGTRRVVVDGLVVLHDPAGLLRTLVAVVTG